jgi:hypothetical protein
MNIANNIPSRPLLSHFAFWDTDLLTLDFDRYAAFAIIRVFERGTAKDISEIIKYYGKSKIIQILTSARSLMPRAMAIGIKLFGLSDNQFTCSKNSPQARHYSRF